MNRKYGAIRVRLLEDVNSGIRVRPTTADTTSDIPVVTSTTADKYNPWIGITAKAGLAGEVVEVFPPYGGLTMVRVQCDETQVKTGWWVNTEENGEWSCHYGAGEIATGVIVSPDLDEDPAVGKVVKAMVFTGRFTYDQQTP